VFETKEELNKSIPFVDGMTQQRFDVKSALKNTLEKLYRVVRAVDLMFMESLGNLINNSLTSMSTMLRTKISSYELSTS
jgi:Ni2+-binding GTPase involved in maturation of urease and hydrogenase